MNIGILILVLISFILLGVISYYTSVTAVKIKGSTTPEGDKAYKYVVIATSLGWISLFLILVGGGYLIFKSGGRGSGAILNIIFVLMGIMITICSILCFTAAAELKKSSDYAANNYKKYHTYLIGSGIGGIVAVVLVSLIPIIKFIIKNRNKNKYINTNTNNTNTNNTNTNNNIELKQL